jgi:hypothetical protein
VGITDFSKLKLRDHYATVEQKEITFPQFYCDVRREFNHLRIVGWNISWPGAKVLNNRPRSVELSINSLQHIHLEQTRQTPKTLFAKCIYW